MSRSYSAGENIFWRWPVPAFFVEFNASGMDAFERELLAGLARVKRFTLRRGQRLLAESVNQAFLGRGYESGTITGPSLNGSEPKREKGGRWKPHAPSTVLRREAWAKRNGPPAGDELRLTDSLRKAATDTTGNVRGSAAFIDEEAGEAGIGVTLDEFPGAAAHQWGYRPRKLPARAYLGLTTTTAKQIEREAAIELSYMAEQVERKFGR
jgi:phage gpG-like protein